MIASILIGIALAGYGAYKYKNYHNEAEELLRHYIKGAHREDVEIRLLDIRKKRFQRFIRSLEKKKRRKHLPKEVVEIIKHYYFSLWTNEKKVNELREKMMKIRANELIRFLEDEQETELTWQTKTRAHYRKIRDNRTINSGLIEGRWKKFFTAKRENGDLFKLNFFTNFYRSKKLYKWDLEVYSSTKRRAQKKMEVDLNVLMTLIYPKPNKKKYYSPYKKKWINTLSPLCQLCSTCDFYETPYLKELITLLVKRYKCDPGVPKSKHYIFQKMPLERLVSLHLSSFSTLKIKQPLYSSPIQCLLYTRILKYISLSNKFFQIEGCRYKDIYAGDEPLFVKETRYAPFSPFYDLLVTLGAGQERVLAKAANFFPTELFCCKRSEATLRNLLFARNYEAHDFICYLPKLHPSLKKYAYGSYHQEGDKTFFRVYTEIIR